MDFGDHFQRVDRAERLGAELASSIQSWAAQEPFKAVGSIAVDRMSWELRLHVSQSPPLGEWGLQFGESAHHLRAALDNLAVSIAKNSGVTRAALLRNIYFPICQTEGDWQSPSTQKKLESLPQAYRDAIEQIQPFQRLGAGVPGTVDEDLLPILSSLDNKDKHHLQVKPTFDAQSIMHESRVEFKTVEGAAASVPPEVEIFSPEFQDGELMIRQSTKGEIAKINGRYDLAVKVQVSLADGRQFGATEILAACCIYVRAIISHIASVN